MKKILLLLMVLSGFQIKAQCWKTIAAGGNTTIAIKTDGTLWAWGGNKYGLLGDGTTTDKNVPTQIGKANNWKSVVVGGNHAVAIKTDGTLWAWGDNSYGQLGNGTTVIQNVPTQIGTANNWKIIAAGSVHTLAITEDGSLWAWGGNWDGELGDGTLLDKNIPTRVGTGTDWQTIEAGGFYTVALKADGTLWSWGYNVEGQLGNGTLTGSSVPKQIGTAIDWKTIAAGYGHAVAVKTDGTLWAWGKNLYGSLGDGTTTNRNVPTQVGVSTSWNTIAVGNSHSIAQKNDGTLWAWGDNYYGELGNGTNTNSLVPIRVISENDWQMMDGGSDHTVALKTDGSIWTWGDNSNGQLGNGTTTSRKSASPISCPVGPLTATIAISNVSCANSATGSASITSVSGGTGPYSYIWSNGAQTATVTGLTAGAYVCTITDVTSLSFSRNFTITEPTYLSFTTTDASACNGSNGSLTVMATGGTAPYAYSIGGINYQTSNVFAGLSAGTYMLFVKDANGCMVALNVVIADTTPPPTATAQTFYLFATVADLEAAGLDLKWYDNGIGGTPLDISAMLQTGKYYVSQTINGCESTRTTVDVIVIPADYISINGEFEDKLIALGIDTSGKDGLILFSDIENVKTIDVSNSNITDLWGIEYFISLETLICKSNQITILDVTKNTALKYLDCSENPLTDLDVTKNTELTELYCDGIVQITKKSTVANGSLTSLDLSNNPLLVKLSCSNNKLTSLDLSKNPLLTDINCSNNELVNLNLKNGNNTGISNLDIKSNSSLSCVQVDDATYSDNNWSETKDPTATYDTTCSFLGIKESVFDSVSVHPNPTQGELHIDNIVLEKASIFNAMGKVVKTMKFSSYAKNNVIDLTGLSSGVYFLYLTSEGTNATKKIILE